MDIKTIILIFCVIDIMMGFWCLFLSIQSKQLEELEKRGNKNGK